MQPGTCLGDRYTIEEHIGTGEYGSVWSGHDSVRNRPVRIKALAKELSRDETIREQFRLTSQRVAPLSVPGIVDVFDCVEVTEQGDTIVCQIAELVEGEPLSRKQQDAPLETDNVLFTMADAAWVLQEAHDEGVRHLNLKPSNLIVDDARSVTIVDFGFNPHSAPADPARPYAAPELLGGGDVGVCADVFSLGVIAYECLTGSKPFDADTASQLAAVHRKHAPVPLPASIPPAAAVVIMKALAADPAQRYASAADLALDCRQVNFTNDVLGALLERSNAGPRPHEDPESTQAVRRPTSNDDGQSDQDSHVPPGHDSPQLATTTPRVSLPIVPEPKVPSGEDSEPPSKPPDAATQPRPAAGPPPPSAGASRSAVDSTRRAARSRRKRLVWIASCAVVVVAVAAAGLFATFIPNGLSGAAADDRGANPHGLDSTSSLTPGSQQSADGNTSSGSSHSESESGKSAPKSSDSESESDPGKTSDSDDPEEPEQVEVPKVVGHDSDKATDLLSDAELKINIVTSGEGRVECNVGDQNPDPGVRVDVATTVDVEVKRTDDPENCEEGAVTPTPEPD